MSKTTARAPFEPKEISERDRVQLLAAALDLCPSCQVKIQELAVSSGVPVDRMVRDIIWRWMRVWDHGAGCPKGEPR